MAALLRDVQWIANVLLQPDRCGSCVPRMFRAPSQHIPKLTRACIRAVRAFQEREWPPDVYESIGGRA